jgi:very-short-patch-repair endonuclease
MATEKTKIQKQIASALREHLERALETQLKQVGATGYLPQFCPILNRKYRSDFAFVDNRLLVEVQGGTWVSGRHNRASAMAAEYERHNTLTLAGWRILYFTADQVHAGTAIKTILAALKCG